MAAVEAEGLVKIYSSRKSEVRALDGVDLEVPKGTVLGLLGPTERARPPPCASSRRFSEPTRARRRRLNVWM